MEKRNRFKFWSALFVASAFIISAGIAYGGAPYEELVKIYLEKESIEKQIESSGEYAPGAERVDVANLWQEIASENDPYTVSEKGIRLLNYLVEGDVSRWNQLEGFVGPDGYPKSVVAFNTALYSISALLELEDPVSSRKAYELAKDLFDSRETIGVIYRSSGKAAFREKGNLRELAGSKWIQNQGYELWNVNEKDSRPFGIDPVRKVRGYINVSEAVSRKMVFLNSNGQVYSGSGWYAWDWISGKVYRVRDREKSDEENSRRVSRQAPDPGDEDDNGGPAGDDDDDDYDNGSPGNGNGNSGNPGNGGGNNNGSGPGSGNGGDNNGQGNDSDSGNGRNGNTSNSGENGSNSGLGDGTNPGNGSDNNNAGDSPGGTGTNNPGGN